MTRITLSLEACEKEALIELAARELRDPQSQAALIIRNDLERRGFLAASAKNKSPIFPTREDGTQTWAKSCGKRGVE
jgi:hypothetical protein